MVQIISQMGRKSVKRKQNSGDTGFSHPVCTLPCFSPFPNMSFAYIYILISVTSWMNQKDNVLTFYHLNTHKKNIHTLLLLVSVQSWKLLCMGRNLREQMEAKSTTIMIIKFYVLPVSEIH